MYMRRHCWFLLRHNHWAPSVDCLSCHHQRCNRSLCRRCRTWQTYQSQRKTCRRKTCRSRILPYLLDRSPYHPLNLQNSCRFRCRPSSRQNPCRRTWPSCRSSPCLPFPWCSSRHRLWHYRSLLIPWLVVQLKDLAYCQVLPNSYHRWLPYIWQKPCRNNGSLCPLPRKQWLPQSHDFSLSRYH